MGYGNFDQIKRDTQTKPSSPRNDASLTSILFKPEADVASCCGNQPNKRRALAPRASFGSGAALTVWCLLQVHT